MTPVQQEQLRAAVRANPACADALAAKDCHALAAILSVGRTRPAPAEIGNGTIIETLGVVDGNKLLDHIAADPNMRYVKPLLDQGRLKVGSPVVQDAIRDFAANALISLAQADALCALGVEQDPLSALDVAEALFTSDGSEK